MVPVPDDPMHMAAFLGAIADLGSGYKWQDDPYHKAKDVAKVWQEISDNLVGCLPVIQFRQSDDCTLQVSVDSGVTWTTIFNSYICAIGAARDEIQNQVNDGQLSGGGQQPGQGGGTPFTCYDYNVTLQGNNRWLAPIALEDGDTIQVTLATGAWWDGDIGQAWKCPEGVEFILGTCNTLSHNTDSGDPLPSVYHMRLIGNLPADGTTPYFDIYDTTYTVPSGIASGQLYLQANDGMLSDNQGSINFHVQICKGAAHWVHTFNFLVADGSFYAFQPIVQNTQWFVGIGWVGTQNLYYNSIAVLVPGTTHIDFVSYHVITNGNNTGSRDYGWNKTQSGVRTAWYDNSSAASGNQTYTDNTPADFLSGDVIDFTSYDTSATSFAVVEIIFSGTGVDPF